MALSMASQALPRYRAIHAAAMTPMNIGTWTSTPYLTIAIAITAMSIAKVISG